MTTSEYPSIVGQIVGRCHVGDSNRTVIKYFISRLKKGRKTWSAMPRDQRKQWLQWIVQCHRDNGALYDYVMRGGRA